MEKLEYFILKRTALDNKQWYCVCYYGIKNTLCTKSKHKRKKDAQYHLKLLTQN